jgi:NADPH:quinone reductase-like Zn-dependent oxidoreductase
VIPGSDLGGTIAAVGDSVKLWCTGDRVCANFAIDYLDGDSMHEIKDSALGAPIDGVLKEYVVLPAHVSPSELSMFSYLMADISSVLGQDSRAP